MAREKSTPVTIPATQAHRHFGDLIRRVFSGKEHFVVEKDGLPVAAIISMDEYEKLTDEQEKQARLKQFQEAARSIGEEIERLGLTEEELMAKVEETRQHLHEERYGKR